MYIKEIAKLKRMMAKTCNKAINEIIEQLIANENIHKVQLCNPDAEFQASQLNIKFEMDVDDKVNNTHAFKVFCNPAISLK